VAGNFGNNRLSNKARKPPALLLVTNKISVWNEGAMAFKKGLEDKNCQAGNYTVSASI
jgi:hypothetical protein